MNEITCPTCRTVWTCWCESTPCLNAPTHLCDTCQLDYLEAEDAGVVWLLNLATDLDARAETCSQPEDRDSYRREARRARADARAAVDALV